MFPETIVLINTDGSERTMSGEQFEQIINARLRNVPQAEGSMNAKVVSVNEYTDEETGEVRFIVGLNVVAPDQVQAIVAAIQAGDYQAALNTSLSSNVRPNSKFIPSQGEIIKISLGMVTNREGAEVLRVTGMSPLPKAATKTFSLADLLAGSTPNPEPATNAAPLSAAAIQGMGKDELLALAQANGIDVSSHLTGGGAIKAAAIPTVVALLTEELV